MTPPAVAAPAVDPLLPVLKSITPSITPIILPPVPNIKYQEHQSICRQNGFDSIFFLPEATKLQRLKMIQDKVKSEPTKIAFKFRLFKEFIMQRNLKEAQQIFEDIREGKTSESELAMLQGALAYLKKDTKKARDFLNKALQLDSKNIEALKWLAEEYKTETNYFEASTIYYDLMKLTSENQNENLCEVLTLDAHYTDAEPLCLKGDSEKKSPYFSVYLGVAARERGNLKEARKHFLSSLKIKPTEMANVCLGEVFTLEKASETSEKYFDAAVSVNPKSTRALLGLAWAAFSNKNRLKALENFKAACGLDKKTIVEIRKALKIILEEKSDLAPRYIEQVQRCIDS